MKTERLVLRKWTEADADSLFEYAKNPEVGPVAGWPPHKSVEESKEVIRNVFNAPECYAICEKENNIAIGAVELKLNGYTDMTQRDDECELGYWLGQPFGGKGYMPEAARESLRHGFEDLFCFLGAKSFMPGIAPPATDQKYRLATLQYGLNLRRYFSNSLRSIFLW